jgi:hypothetical protein
LLLIKKRQKIEKGNKDGKRKEMNASAVGKFQCQICQKVLKWNTVQSFGEDAQQIKVFF